MKITKRKTCDNELKKSTEVRVLTKITIQLTRAGNDQISEKNIPLLKVVKGVGNFQ